VVLVTADVKEDWWRKTGGATRGPRLELSRELANACGTRLYMLRPASLFVLAESSLGVSIGPESVKAAESVDRMSRVRRRGPIEKLPDGRGGAYLDIVIELVALADRSPTLDEYLESLQMQFPMITRKDEARRRMRSLETLELLEVVEKRVLLTKLGQQLLDERALSLLQDAFMRCVNGASEVRERASQTSLATLRSELRDSPPEGLSSTQGLLVLRWLEQLELV
jgi:hypothetical protein